MCRIVRDYVAVALVRHKQILERLIAERLEYPDAFPLNFAKPTAAIHEFRRVTIAPHSPGDYPPTRPPPCRFWLLL